MDKTFTEQFRQQILLEDEVANKWGYRLDSSAYKPESKTKKKLKDTRINESIKPLTLEQKKVPKSEKHLLLQREIQANQYRKKMEGKSKEKQHSIMDLMNERIKQYNYLVDHKHIKMKNSEDTKKVLKLKPKSDAEKILEQINGKNNEMVKEENLKTQYKLNKNITTLYRKYKDKMYDDEEINPMNKTVQVPLKDSKKFITRKKNTVENYGRKKSVKMRQIRSIDSNLRLEEGSRQATEIDEAYISKQIASRGKQFDKTMITGREISEHWKLKVKSVCPVKDSELKGGILLQKTPENKKSQAKSHRVIDTDTIERIRQKKQMQEKYVSKFLDKRHRKFKKPWGNKILIKYNSKNEAKSMLDGSGNVSPVKGHKSSKSLITSQIKKIKSVYGNTPVDISPQNLKILESMRQEENDEKYQETMYKNEKVNLFLKDRKR